MSPPKTAKAQAPEDLSFTELNTTTELNPHDEVHVHATASRSHPPLALWCPECCEVHEIHGAAEYGPCGARFLVGAAA